MQKRISEKGWALLPLRLMIGFGFAAHGYAKLSQGPENFAAILTAIEVPQPHLMAWVTSLLELMGGISVMAGWSIRSPAQSPLGTRHADGDV